ncbi:DUF3014 domain-containing protein [Aliiglaciecola litoralis]|uniref:DUF3014 domain-containing protein n=1 Tax=Aliiglaciecola litoralis TaxID=582857 RepID=A0ABN1LFS8_9ALTE
MTEETQAKSLTPHIIITVIVVIVVIIAYFGFSKGDEQEQSNLPTAVEETIAEPMPESEFDLTDEYATEDNAPVIEEPVIIDMPEPQPVPEPLDTSDATIKTSLLNIANYEAAAKLLVNDDLLRRFVVLTQNIANKSTANNHQVVVEPEEDFKVYNQAGQTFIDAASFKRYTPYVETLTSMETDALVSMLETYKPAMQDIYAEIGDPQDDFKFVMMDAINHLLDTPEVPVPIEVHTDSVMFKFKDERLENLSSPQKQLLRTGPENMRRIKAKLRDIKQAIQ